MDIYLSDETVSVPVVSVHTVVVGSGAAGYNAALRLKKYGVDSVAIITEGKNIGTSRNTGSDKQTYYKLNLCGTAPDSPGAMARDLFAGGCVDGDIAYAEAALSVPCFLQLAELGVPFPTNRYGEYIGYQTDHDLTARATSAGPLTSKLMTQCLEKSVESAGIEVYDHCLAVQILCQGDRAIGLLALDLEQSKEQPVFVVFRCENIIFATGGPAGIYSDTVYPCGHRGSSGVAFEAGVYGRNLTEWQYGLASVSPRWNVSGTYMQVLPRFVSVDADGQEYEFLAEHYGKGADYLSLVFKKGYEWPFDCNKAHNGSSVIDLLVYRETVLRKRRVFLDYRSNPEGCSQLDYSCLTEEARGYLEKANACFGTPIERLIHMNEPAYELYLSKGVDLKKEMLEIALCAQHNNGGLDIDCWWQTNIRHLFAAGEVAGSHGIYRPGGSALNAGQVGSMRAAQYIAYHKPEDLPVDEADFTQCAYQALIKHYDFCRHLLSGGNNLTGYEESVRSRMSEAAGAIRSRDKISRLIDDNKKLLANIADELRIPNCAALRRAYQLRDALISQQMYLSAMADYALQVGFSRGSAIYTAADGAVAEGLEEVFRFRLGDSSYRDQIQTVQYSPNTISVQWRPVRPLPNENEAFETVWRNYRQNKNVD